MGWGGGECRSACNAPACNAAQASWVSCSFSAGSVASRQRLAAACRSVVEIKSPPHPGLLPPAKPGEKEQSLCRAARCLGIVRAQHFDLLQIGTVQAGDVFAGEAGGVEVLDLLVAILHGPDQIGQVLVDQP